VSQHRVFLVRHGETEWSRTRRHTGRTDIPLTDRGRTQAERAGRLLAGRDLALVLVSPLGRARTTCELAGFGDRAIVDDDLCEWDYGEIEGRTTAEIREELPGWTVWSGPVSGGETIEQVAARADRVVARCLDAGGDVALFGHGHALRILAARWCELDPHAAMRLPLDTATLCELGWEHEYRTIAIWNMPASDEG
jgi:probable phosphoglycerate mutase